MRGRQKIHIIEGEFVVKESSQMRGSGKREEVAK